MIERAERPRQRPWTNSRGVSVLGLVLAASACAPALRPPVETGKRPPDLVEIVTLEPGIHLDIRYATANNFVGRPVYKEARAFLQRMFRFYGPEKPLFDKTWRLPDVEKVAAN